jgi:hypothetical protein
MTNFLTKKFLNADLLNSIDARINRLKDYINSKELNKLQQLKQGIEIGIRSMNEASWFLSKVPEGKYDANRENFQFYELDNFLNDQSMKCKFYKDSDMELVGENLPYSEEQWMCPCCHGTYNIWEYPIKDK